MVWQVTVTTINPDVESATAESPKALPDVGASIGTRLFRSALWLGAGALAVWIGNTSAPALRTVLAPAGVVEQSMVELFGSGTQWAGLLALIPVIFWATQSRVEPGLVIPLALFATGNGVAAIIFSLAIFGTGVFLDLDDDRWQGPALSGAAAMLIFAVLNPWAGLIAGGVLLLASSINKSVALTTFVVYLPSSLAALLLISFFSVAAPTLIVGIAAVGVISLRIPLIAVGVGVASLLMSFAAPHPAGVLADSFGVYALDVPAEIVPDLLAEGFIIDANARFELVESVDEQDSVVAQDDGWFLVERTSQ